MAQRGQLGRSAYENTRHSWRISLGAEESVLSNILPHLSKLGVDFQKLVQGYDGTSTMAGHVSGVQTHIHDK